MPDAAPRDSRRTRARISAVATTMFLERGFDHVTVAEVAQASGVSKVTVFTHFSRKEDLLLDRFPEATELVRATLHDHDGAVSAVRSLRALADDLLDNRLPLSGLTEGNVAFMRTVAQSPALLGRVRELVGEIEDEVRDLLASGLRPVSEPGVLAALVVSAYRGVMVASAQRILAGDPLDDVEREHRHRLDLAFDALAAAAPLLA